MLALRTNVIDPLTRRAGTAVAAYLVTTGVAEADAAAIGYGVAALCGVLWDLLRSYRNRKEV